MTKKTMIGSNSRNVMRILSANDISKAAIPSKKTSKSMRTRDKQYSTYVNQERQSTAFPVSVGWRPREEEQYFFPRFAMVVDQSVAVSSDSNYSIFEKTHPLFQLLSGEERFHVDTTPLLSVDPVIEDKVDASMRDEALTRMRCLHRAFYDLSPITFCKAVCLVDTFITRVKVKPKYMMCVSAACYYIASKFDSVKSMRPTPDSLVRMSKCGGSSADLVRMVEIILTKLGPATVAAVGATSATALDFLKVFLSTPSQAYVFNSENAICESADLPTFLIRQLEMSLCATESARQRPSCLALSLLYAHRNRLLSTSFLSPEEEISPLLPLSAIFNLASLCKVNWADVDACSLVFSQNPVFIKTADSPEKGCTFIGTSPPPIGTLSRRKQQSRVRPSPPSLATIEEWAEEEN